MQEGIEHMKQWLVLSVAVCLALAVTPGHASHSHNTVVVTSSNDVAGNALLAFDATGALVQTISTGGRGGVSGNAGGIAANGRLVAIVNFGSQSVSLLDLTPQGFTLTDVITTISAPGRDFTAVSGSVFPSRRRTLALPARNSSTVASWEIVEAAVR